MSYVMHGGLQRQRRNRVIARWVAVLLATVGVLAAHSSAANATIGRVGGIVTNSATGQPMAGVRVVILQREVYEDGSSDWSPVYGYEGTTNSNGEYTLFVPQGSYRIQGEYYLDGEYGAHWYRGYYGGSTEDSATDVQVSSGASASGVSFAMSLGPVGKLSGRVTTGDGTPVTYAMVEAYSPSNPGGDAYFVRTGSDGRYTLGVPAGTYRICFRSPGVDCTQSGPAVVLGVSVSSNQTVTVNGQAAQMGSITGTITDTNGNPIPDFYVTLFARDSADGGYGSGYAKTNSLGQFRLFAPNGEWSVGYGTTNSANYSGNEGSPHYDQWVGKFGPNFTIDSSAVLSGFNAQLNRRGGLAGRVMDPNGYPFPNARMLLYELDSTTNTWEPAWYPYSTNQTGYYRIHHADGVYRVCAVTNDPTTFEYVPLACYGGETVEQGTSVTLAAPSLVPSINITMPDSSSTPPPPTPTGNPTSTTPVVPSPTTAPSPSPTSPPAPPADAIRSALTAALGQAKVGGRAKVGKTVAVKGLSASLPTGSSVTYKLQWYTGTRAIKKATKLKLDVTKAMLGKKLSVKISATSLAVTTRKTLKLGKVS